MRPAFLSRPGVWTHAPRTSAAPVDDAYAITRFKPQSDQGGWKSYALAVAIGLAFGWLLAQGV